MSSRTMDGLAEAARLVGDRWSPLVLAALLDGPRRYGELARAVPDISSNVLAQRLSALERDGLVIAEPYSRRPLRVRYALTAAGAEFAPALAAIASWGTQRLPDNDPISHQVCGTPLELHWRCPTCDVDVDLLGDEVTSTIFLA